MMRRWWLGLGALGLGAFLGAADGASAACTVDPCAPTGGGNPAFDCDRDGFTDAEECVGLVTPAAAFAFPSCRVTPTAQPECLDPAVADLFVKFEKAANSAYTELAISDAAAFGLITQPQASGGLPIRVHVRPPTSPFLAVPQPNGITARQAALVVREVRGAASTTCPITAALGAMNGVTSTNGAGIAQIFTQRIIDHVRCVYTSVNQSATSAAASADKIAMIRHTTAHETTHAHRLAPESVQKFGGNHYKTGTGCIMDQSSTYTTKNNVVRFATPLVYCGPDRNAVSAGETALGRIQCEDTGNILDGDTFTNACLPARP
jgi:hypothetical protein